ncbi:hypothetical protein GOP47_0008925 [Adiantum capillus-veneris]|uniref:Uncharacterized protein n=1 Tax=Adiantum capillus-veneris TaxID=13818 RepID=A0A9D4UZ88_ADICA|nr:hypothetical protein GOP47_0008925 [Adiantum capillus-veneris]
MLRMSEGCQARVWIEGMVDREGKGYRRAWWIVNRGCVRCLKEVTYTSEGFKISCLSTRGCSTPFHHCMCSSEGSEHDMVFLFALLKNMYLESLRLECPMVFHECEWQMCDNIMCARGYPLACSQTYHMCQ